MRVTILAWLILSITAFAHSQADYHETNSGEVVMTPILHAALVLEWQEMTIYIDPYGGFQRYSDFDHADLILITHPHGDHLNEETLNGLDLKNTILIAPESVVSMCKEYGFKNMITLVNGEDIEILGINVEAVPMYNLPEDESSRHPKGWGNGYIVTIGGKRYYFSGDTEAIPEMRALKNIDFAFVCMNLPYTMDIDQAAEGVLDFQPKVVYPYHYRGRPAISDVKKFKELVNSANTHIQVRLLNWYPEE
jgi:L-ascorbate metabolism protein UlaG (beta-lactamase superfamily)